MYIKNGQNRKLGAFIVPTGIAASIGGYAGDASAWARKFAQNADLIVNPNVVNAACFSGITPNMFYVEGYSLDQFFKDNLNLYPKKNNKVGIIFDKGICNSTLNVHINTVNAVKTIYGIDIIYECTEKPVKVDFFVDKTGISTGGVKDIQVLLDTAKSLIAKGADTIAVVCKFDENEDSQDQDQDYENGSGVDPVGGVEAIISHYLSKELQVPVAHAPAFDDITISTKIVNPKASAEYITPTFLPCILLGLCQAPLLKNFENSSSMINISNLDFLIMPYNSLGSVPVFQAVKRGIKVFAIKENESILNITKSSLNLNSVIEIDSYQNCLEILGLN